MWPITQLCKDIVLCGTGACRVQNWFEGGEETEKFAGTFLFCMASCALLRARTLDGGVLVDLRRAGGLDDADWWLAIYMSC